MIEESRSEFDIAVVGAACRVPGAADAESFWRLLVAGTEAVRDLSDDELLASGEPYDVLSDPAYVRRGAPLEDADLFDAGFFGFSPREAELMDPQHRVFLETAWHALDDAGLGPAAPESRCGVFAGAGASTYLWRYLLARSSERLSLSELALANNADGLATKVAYKFDLRGPAVSVQTACSSSLVAVHYACQSLIIGDCDLAIAGGVRVTTPLIAGYHYLTDGINSPDGHCRAFDERAGGTVAGSGAGAVVLKRLDDALRAGDRIRAVIRGSAVNNDGAGKVGFSAPSVRGQADVVRAALRASGLSARDVTYVEAHGTGTMLGDPVEVAALSEAFGARSTDGRCWIGSVKTNLGHLDAAAGIIGLIKVVLMLENGIIPASLHFRRPNPELHLEESPFAVNDACRPWVSAEPRRAGVSSFGIGGTNAHVVLEQAPAAPPHDVPAAAYTLALSAKTANALTRAAADLAEVLARTDLPLADVAYTTQVGRRAFSHRWSFVCSTRAEAVDALRSAQSALAASAVEPRVVFVCPGQGAEYRGMARELFSGDRTFASLLDESLHRFEPPVSEAARSLLLDACEHEEAAERTDVTQAALFCVEYALGRTLLDLGIKPAALLGHSLGEIVAACLAGVMSPAAAAALVSVRGLAMSNAPPGRMVAVGAAADDVTRLADDKVFLAADNAARQSVFAGSPENIAAFCDRLRSGGIPFRLLRSRHAFHSPFMAGAAEQVTASLRQARFTGAAIPVLSNVSGGWLTAEEAEDPRYWGRQVRSTVRFREAVTALGDVSPTAFVELGPGALVDLAAHGAGRAVKLTTLPAPGEHVLRDGVFERALAGLWQTGATVEWRRRYAPPLPRIAGLPGYPFERKRYWYGTGSPAPAEPARGGVKHAEPRYERLLEKASYAEPATEAERIIAASFGETLNIVEVGAHDSFFALGGDSLLGITLVERLRRTFAVPLSIAMLYDHPTPAQMAETVESLIVDQVVGSGGA